jgi:hypothetical protein
MPGKQIIVVMGATGARGGGLPGHGFLAARDSVLARSWNPELLTFDAWLAVRASRLPIG